MKLNEPLYAIVDPDGKVLGDGECAALSRMEPEPEDINRAGKLGKCEPRVVECVLVPKSEYAAAATERDQWKAACESLRTEVEQWQSLGYWTDVPQWNGKSYDDIPSHAARVNKAIRELCDARDGLKTLTTQLATALQMLRDHQNGPPLPSYEAGWTEAMELTDAALAQKGTE